jgi:non-histone protein 10
VARERDRSSKEIEYYNMSSLNMEQLAASSTNEDANSSPITGSAPAIAPKEDGHSKDSKQNKTTKQIVPFETEALRLKQKCKDLKQKITDIEAQNQVRAIGVSRAKDSISRLRFEYSLLLEFLEKKNSTLAFPGLKNFTAADINAQSVESLSLEDITNLLATTPQALANIKRLLPNILGDFITERQQQYINNLSAAPEQTQVTSGRNRRKRGATNGFVTSTRKRVRDPREPKRPTNAYLFFCDSERDRVKSEWAQNHPNEHIDLSKAMTDVWRKMTDDDKKPYFEMYERDKERYHKAVEEFANIKEQERVAASQAITPSSQPSESASAEPEDNIPTSIISDQETPNDGDVSQLDENIDGAFDDQTLHEQNGNGISHSHDFINAAVEEEDEIEEREDLEEEEIEEEDDEDDEERDNSKISINMEEKNEMLESEDPNMELNSEIHEGEDEEEEDGDDDVEEEEEEEEEGDEQEEEQEGEEQEEEEEDNHAEEIDELDDEEAHNTDMTDNFDDEEEDNDEANLLRSETDTSFN